MLFSTTCFLQVLDSCCTEKVCMDDVWLALKWWQWHRAGAYDLSWILDYVKQILAMGQRWSY